MGKFRIDKSLKHAPDGRAQLCTDCPQELTSHTLPPIVNLMSDIRQRKRPREGEPADVEGSGSGSSSAPDAPVTKLQEQIEGYRHAHDKAVRKASNLERDVLSTTGKIHDSLVQGKDLQIQWILWLKSHITLLKSRCCKCDGPEWHYLFAKCKHKACEDCIDKSGRCCDMSQHMLRIFFADSCVICMIASPGTEMVVNSCGHITCKRCHDGLSPQARMNCVTCRAVVGDPISSYSL